MRWRPVLGFGLPALATASLAAFAAGLPAESASTGSEPARTVYATFQKLASDSIWPGFEPRRIPLAVWDGTRTWLFGHPSPPADFATGAGGVATLQGRHPEVSANSSAILQGVPTATLLLPESFTGTPDSAADLAAVAVHEAFHVFQRQRHKSWSANEVELFTYPCTSETLAALDGLEMLSLQRAAAAPSEPEAAGWALAALAERRARFARMRPEAVQYERTSELNEGLAQYVQNRALRLQNAGTTAASSRGAPRILKQRNFAPDAVRSRVYVSGETWAILLDRFQPDWRDSLEANDARSLDVLLHASLEHRSSGPAAHQAHFSSADLETAHRDARAGIESVQATRSEAKRSFLARQGDRLEIVVDSGEPLWGQGFDPLNVQLLDGGAVLHGRWVKLGNKQAQIEIFSRPSLTEPAGKHPLFEGVRSLTVTGLEAPPAIETHGDTLVLKAQGVECRAIAALLEQTPGSTTVRWSGTKPRNPKD